MGAARGTRLYPRRVAGDVDTSGIDIDDDRVRSMELNTRVAIYIDGNRARSSTWIAEKAQRLLWLSCEGAQGDTSILTE